MEKKMLIYILDNLISSKELKKMRKPHNNYYNS